MIRELCTKIYNNKNSLMMFSVGFYVMALFSVLTNNLLFISFLLTIFSIIGVYKNLFPKKIIFIWLFLFYLGVVNTTIRIKTTDELFNLAPVNSEISGVVSSIPKGFSDGKPKFYFDVKTLEFGDIKKEFKNEKVLVNLNISPEQNFEAENIKLYNSYKFKGRLSTPFKVGNPSQFDYGNYLRNYDTYAVFYAKDFEKLESKLTFKQKTLQRINEYREKIISVHSEYLKSPNLEILGGIVFGDDAVSPPKNIKQSFVNSGLLHILAASGMNVAFIWGFFSIVLSWFKVNFKLNVSLGILAVLIYLLMTGMGASVVRAAFMLIFVLVGKLIDRDANSVALLSFVALLMLLYNPMYVNDVGFQLSFIVTFGLLVMTPVLFQTKSKIINWVIGAIAIPIFAQLWVIPLQIFYFNNISLYSIFANIMSVPILFVISFGGFISSLLCLISPISHFVCMVFDFILNPLITILVNISDFWGHLPHSAIQTTHPSVFQIILYYGVLGCMISIFYKEIREKYLKKIVITFAILFTIWMITLVPVKNANLEITAFDVGNADCFLLKTPKNEYIMIDTGKSGYNGGKSQAEIIMLKYFKDRGIKHLNSIIVTHFDNDHSGGAVNLMTELKVDKLYVNDLNNLSNLARAIYAKAKDSNTETVLAKNNEIIYEKEGIKLINYKLDNFKSDNDKSIVTLLQYNDFSMLFTGDAGIKALTEIIKNIPKDIDVLKVPHHGASNVLNKEIVQYLNPKYSIVSVGENKFGHPNLYTLKLLEKSKILRTDKDNSIKISADKNQFKIGVFDTKSRKYENID